MRARTASLRRLAGAAVAALVTSAALAQTQPAPVQVAAVVNGEPITMTDVQKLLSQAPGGAPGAGIPEIQQRQMQYEALQLLIDDLLMQQFLLKNAPRVEPAEVDQHFAKLEQSLKQQNRTLQDYLHETGETEGEVRANILKQLQKVAYLAAHLSDADVKRFYDENRDFFDLVRVKASHILIRLPPNATDAQREDARAQLRHLRQMIVTGKISFAEAAKKYSQCPTAPNGGDLGAPFPRKFALQEPFAKAAFEQKVGEVSDVVQTDYGLHLILTTERLDKGPKSDFKTIKEDVRQFASQEMMQNLIVQLRQSAEVKINLGAPAGR